MGTVIYRGSRTEGKQASVRPLSNSLSRTWAADDRPITPMKNTMIYDVEHSSLDFKDGENA